MVKSESMKRAQTKYRLANKEKSRRQSYKSTTKLYIKTSTGEELDEVRVWVHERMMEI